MHYLSKNYVATFASEKGSFNSRLETLLRTWNNTKGDREDITRQEKN